MLYSIDNFLIFYKIFNILLHILFSSPYLNIKEFFTGGMSP